MQCSRRRSRTNRRGSCTSGSSPRGAGRRFIRSETGGSQESDSFGGERSLQFDKIGRASRHKAGRRNRRATNAGKDRPPRKNRGSRRSSESRNRGGPGRNSKSNYRESAQRRRAKTSFASDPG